MAENPLTGARDQAAAASEDAQDRNCHWWEQLPMTYVPWETQERGLSGAEAFASLEADFLRLNPWLGETFDFTKFAGLKVLEIGCGAGAAACLFAKGDAAVGAIDITENAVRLTRENAAAQGLRMTVEQMDAEQIRFPADSFDFVFSWGVLHHSRNTEAAIGEVGRILKPGGSGLIMVYNRESLRYYLKGLIWLIFRGKLFHGHGLSTVQQFYTDGYHQRHFGKRELASVLLAAGLQPGRFSVTHMTKKMLPLIPVWLDGFFKKTLGWLLIVEFTKSSGSAR